MSTQLSYHSLDTAASQASLALPSELVGNPLPPAVLSAPPTPWALLAALRRRWILALTLGMIAAVIGVATIWFLPLTWRVRTLLHVSAIRPHILFQTPASPTDFVNSRSQLALVKSRLVLQDALTTPEVASLPVVRLQSKPIEWLEKQLQVDFSMGPEILAIAMTCNDQDTIEDLVKIVTAVRNSYVKEIVNKEQNQRIRQLADLERIFETKDNDLRKKLEQQKKAAEPLGSKQASILQMQLKFRYDELGALHQELVKSQSRIRTLKNELYFLDLSQKKIQEAELPPKLMEDVIKAHPELGKLKQAVDDQQTRIDDLRPRVVDPDKHPKILELRKELAQLQQDYQKRRSELLPQLTKQAREDMLAGTKDSIFVKREELIRHENEEKNLSEQVTKKLQEIDTLTKGSSNLESLHEDISGLQEVHKKINSQIEALKVEKDAPSRISVLEETFAQQTRTSNDRRNLAILAAAGLFVLAVCGVAFLEFSSRRVSNLGDVTQGLGLRILGVLPSVPTSAWGGGQVQRLPRTRWQRILRESVDSARTMLVHAVQNNSLRAVIVTSAVKGEGKTLLCTNLAVSIAQAGIKTLLIDADFRHPAVHRQFGLTRSPGMSDVLQGKIEADAAMHLELVPGLTVLTAGQWDILLPDVLAQQQRLAALLDRFKNEYDFILIDTAPVLVAPDTLMLSRHVDGVLLSLLRGVSRLPLVYSACERLMMLGVRILGAVVGKADVNSGYAYSYQAPADALPH